MDNNEYRDELLDDFLEHHGVKFQRWGHRRYQNYDGSLTPLGRIHRGLKSAKRDMSRGVKSIEKDVKKAASKVKKAVGERSKNVRGYTEHDPEKIKELVDKAIQNGDADTLYKYRNTLSTNELREAANRLNEMKRIKDFAPQHLTGAQKALKVVEGMTKANNAIGNYRKSVNNLLGRDQKKKNKNKNGDSSEKKKNKDQSESSSSSSSKTTTTSTSSSSSYTPLSSLSNYKSPSVNKEAISKKVNSLLDYMSSDMDRYSSKYGSSGSRDNTKELVSAVNRALTSSYNMYGGNYKKKKSSGRSISDRLNTLYGWD